MESLHDQQQPDADPGIPGELDYAATATSNRDATASAVLLPRSTLPTARREEVQRLFCSVLVIRCESNTQYAAPVIVMSQEDSNIYAVLERHLKREYLLGAEKFWRLVRAELGVDTWRPRVQGAQLKALLGARLPEYEQEFQEIQRVVDSLQDCILPESSPEALMQDLRTTISQIQAWWENRNKKSDGSYKRPGPAPAGFQQHASKRRAIMMGPLLDQQMLALGDVGEQQDVMADPAATAAALTAAAAAAATAGFMDLGPGDLGGLRLPFHMNGLEHQPPAAPGMGPAAGSGAAAAAAAAGGLDTSLLGAAAAAAAATGNPLSPFLSNPGGLLVLDVGGKIFRTTLSTLLAVQGSLFWQVCYGQTPPGVIQRLSTGEVFVDRSGEQFSYVLEYLRACACNDITFPLPNDARELQALAREAFFYQLTDLLQHIQQTVIMPHPSTRTFFDMAYLETGFRALEGPGAMRNMERAKMVMMQQLNQIVHEKHLEGFAVEEVLPGTAHRQDAEGKQMQHNLYYNVLLKKVVPLLPQEMTVDDDEEQEEDEEAPQQQQQQHNHQQQQQQQQQQQYSAGSGGAAGGG